MILQIRRTAVFCLTLSALLGALTITGCSNAKGRDLEPREKILKTLADQGFVFSRHVISTVYGENQNQVVVSGPMAQRTPDNSVVPNGFKVTQYKSVVVEKTDVTWKVASTTKVQP